MTGESSRGFPSSSPTFPFSYSYSSSFSSFSSLHHPLIPTRPRLHRRLSKCQGYALPFFSASTDNNSLVSVQDSMEHRTNTPFRSNKVANRFFWCFYFSFLSPFHLCSSSTSFFFPFYSSIKSFDSIAFP